MVKSLRLKSGTKESESLTCNNVDWEAPFVTDPPCGNYTAGGNINQFAQLQKLVPQQDKQLPQLHKVHKVFAQLLPRLLLLWPLLMLPAPAEGAAGPVAAIMG